MRNKVLIIDADPAVHEVMEQILQEVVRKGGELLFAHTQAQGISLFEKEKPQLVFLDSSLVGENEDVWVKRGVHVVLMQPKQQTHQKSEDFILKPPKATPVLKKCWEVLNPEVLANIPPM